MKTSEHTDLSANVLALDALVDSLIQSIEPKIEEILRAQREQEKTVETFATHQRRLKARVEELLQYLIEEEEEYSLVGNFIFELSAGESWTLGPESVFKMKDITRSLLLREAYMIQDEVSLWKKTKQIGATAVRRFITGEPIILDVYTAEKDNSLLGISTDEVGSNLCRVTVNRPIISRKAIYFASEKNVKMRIHWPGSPNKWKKLVYGPGYVFQRFEPFEGSGAGRDGLLHIDGDMHLADLEPGETMVMDPRHSCAWDESVSLRLVRFGPVWDRLLRGLIPFYTEFRGPGRVWYSTQSFDFGFLGYWGTPTAWLRLAYDRAMGIGKPLLGFGSE